MAAYNAESVLGATIDSILAQTYRDFELVIVDNGSTDGTARVVEGYDDERIRLTVVSKSGGYEGMNHALSLATGDLLAVYHADDLYEPTIVEREVEFLDRNPAAGAVFALDHYIDEHGRVFGGTDMPRNVRGLELLEHEHVFRHVLRHKNTLLRCPTFMTRRAVLEDVGTFDPAAWDIASDLELWLRLSSRYPIGVLDERLLRYRVWQHNWSARYERLRTDEEKHFQVVDHFIELDRAGRRVARRADLRRHEFHRCHDDTTRATNHILRGEFDEARDLLRRRYGAPVFWNGVPLRSARILTLRTMMRLSLALRIRKPLRRVLRSARALGGLA
jgi:glycosyltransferase involved in cell wall biosynthesis